MTKPVLKMIDPHQLEIPEIRVTAEFSPEERQAFADDIKAAGIEEALIIAEDDGHLWVIDGANRRDVAITQGLKTVPCLVRKRSLVEIQIRNLVHNTMRGRVRPTQQALVLRDLFDNRGVTIEDITSKTGKTREWVEQMIKIGRCEKAVLDDLDAGKIRTCHAAALAEVKDPDTQVRLLNVAITYRVPCEQFRGVVAETLRIQKEQADAAGKAPAAPPPAEPTATCSVCGLEHRLADVQRPPICRFCYAIGIAAVQQEIAAAAERGKAGQSPGAPAPGGS